MELKKNNYNKLHLSLIVLMIVTILLGSWLYIGLASLYHFVVLLTLLFVLQKDNYSLKVANSNKMLVFTIIWLVEALISCIWAADKDIAIKYTYNIFLIFLYSYTMHRLFKISMLDFLISFMVVVLFVLNTIALWESTTGNHLVANFLYSQGRTRKMMYTPGCFFLNPNDLAFYIFEILPFSFSGVFGNNKLLKVLALINIPFSILTVFLTQSRTIVIVLFFTLFFYLFFALKKRTALIISFALCLCGYGFLLVYPNFLNLLTDGIESVTGNVIMEDNSLGVRFSLFANGVNMLIDYFGLGVGAGCHRVLMPDYSNLYYDTGKIAVMHNLFGEIFVDYGILIGFLFVGTIWIIIKRLYYMQRFEPIMKKRVLFMMLAVNAGTLFLCGISSSSVIQIPSIWTTLCLTGACISHYKADSVV